MKFSLEIDIDQLGESSLKRIFDLIADHASKLDNPKTLADPMGPFSIRTRINGTPIRIGKWKIRDYARE